MYQYGPRFDTIICKSILFSLVGYLPIPIFSVNHCVTQSKEISNK